MHVGGNTAVVSKLKLIENSSVTLYCNSTALPNSISYEWYLNDALLRGMSGFVYYLVSSWWFNDLNNF